MLDWVDTKIPPRSYRGSLLNTFGHCTDGNNDCVSQESWRGSTQYLPSGTLTDETDQLPSEEFFSDGSPESPDRGQHICPDEFNWYSDSPRRRSVEDRSAFRTRSGLSRTQQARRFVLDDAGSSVQSMEMRYYRHVSRGRTAARSIRAANDDGIVLSATCARYNLDSQPEPVSYHMSRHSLSSRSDDFTLSPFSIGSTRTLQENFSHTPQSAATTPSPTKSYGSILERHKKYARDSLDLLPGSLQGDEALIQLARGQESKRNTFGRRTVVESPGGPETQNLVIGILSKKNHLEETELLIDERHGQLRVVDPVNRLGFNELPLLAGYMQKKNSQNLGIFSWNTRFVVIQQCTIYWFHNRRDFLQKGVGGATGSISLIIFKCSIDIVANQSRQFSIRVTGADRAFIFDCWRSEHDRGKWLVTLLAHNHKAYEIRIRFSTVDWPRLQEEALKSKLSKFWKNELNSGSSVSGKLRRLSAALVPM